MSFVRDCVVGDIYLIHCTEDEIGIAKPKMCICVLSNQFFLINTEPAQTDNLEILQAEHKFLEYDSNVNCGINLEFDHGRKVIKRYASISDNLLAGMIETVEDAKVLTPLEKRSILASLRDLQLKRNA